MNSELFGKLPLIKMLSCCAVSAVIILVLGDLYSVADGIFLEKHLVSNVRIAIDLIIPIPIIMIVEALSNVIATGSLVNMLIPFAVKGMPMPESPEGQCPALYVGCRFFCQDGGILTDPTDFSWNGSASASSCWKASIT